MDVVLLPYLQATDDSAREKCLGELLLFHADPVVRHTMRRALGFNVSQGGTNRFNHDAQDLYQEIMTKIVQALNELRTSQEGVQIENLKQYVRRIALNVCNDFLRAKSRPRALLEHKLRDLFSRHPDFATWRYDDKFVCGFSVWQQEATLPASTRQVAEFENDLQSFRATQFPSEDIHQVPLTRIVAELLQWIGRPLERDALSSIIANLLRVSNRHSESLSDERNAAVEARLVDSRFRADATYEAKALLERLWKIVKALPPHQRDTFCLGFEDESGTDLLTLLLDAGLVTLPELAAGLNRSLEELVRLRRLVPMDNLSIADELHASRSQVVKWRFRVVRRLKKELLG